MPRIPDADGYFDSCSQCGAVAPVVMVGEDYDYETQTAVLCAVCLKAALALLEAHAPTP